MTDAADHPVFERVVCGVDRSESAFEAAWQAAMLSPPEAEVVLVTAFDDRTEDGLRWAEHTLADAESVVGEAHRVTTRLEPGHAVGVLRTVTEREHATLLAIGIYYRSRSEGIAAGAIAPALLHRAPCSVLIGRVPAHRDRFPQTVVVGVDGSAPSLAAVAAAQELSERLRCTISAVLATGNHHVDPDAVREQFTAWPEIPLVIDHRAPVDALCDRDADLLVVGSRGVHGFRSLGSVSERVAHHAQSSVLVVR